ncbi:hypothetical protein [Butyrivibrio fibrisolvens]|uniref:hypothetical protein n=1 Tax=Butyrivibrio fibrisolvens TaxID=831 RepID=UPI001FA80A64|nr:hypothetical protein [Butyrivibrio fibrisolvens]
MGRLKELRKYLIIQLSQILRQLLVMEKATMLNITVFLEFLDKNDALIRDGQKVISDGVLVAITLMIVESNPEEKDIMTTLVMNLLKM